MNTCTAIIILGLASCVLSEYVPKKSCRQECTTSLDCQHGFVCKSVGCNSLCSRIGGVLPVDPILPIDPIVPGCIDQCRSSVECGIRGVCVQDGCRRVCQNRVINAILPVDPVIGGCIDECKTSLECGRRGVCIQQGCRRVCQNRVIIDPVLPVDPIRPIDPIIPVLPKPGCVNECITSSQCGFGMTCVKRGCRNVCLKGVLQNDYKL